MKTNITRRWPQICLALALFFLFGCKNPYITHNLLRPVYLAGLDIRSEVLSADDPSHGLDKVFMGSVTSYSAVVPYNAEVISINAIPEEGAAVLISGLEFSAGRNFPREQNEKFVTITVKKEYRIDTVYTLTLIRGKPEAQLAGLELYISSDPDAADWSKYQHEDYVLSFVPERGMYHISVPAYANNIALVSKSPVAETSKVLRLSYEFKMWESDGGAGGVWRTISSDGRNIAPWTVTQTTHLVNAGSSPPIPDWSGYPSEIPVGDIQIYAGGSGVYPLPPGSTWFGKDVILQGRPDGVSENPANPKRWGRLAAIHVTAQAANLDPKTYVIEITREEASAYLDGLKVYKNDETSPNRIDGNYSRTVLNYTAGLPDDVVSVTVVPQPDANYTFVSLEYAAYYFTGDGKRYYIGTDNAHHEYILPDEPGFDSALISQLKDGSLLPSLTPASYWKKTTLSNPPEDILKIPFNIGNVSFQNYTSMEVVIKASASGVIDKIYRVRIRREKDKASLTGITVNPYNVLALPAMDANTLSAFDRFVQSYTASAEAGRTHARVTLDNSLISGTQNRRISISVGGAVINSFHLEGGIWKDDAAVAFGTSPFVDVALNGRNTVVKIAVSDIPQYADNEYIVNILSKNRNDIILPLDGENDGQVRAVFATGDDAGLNATSVLPGELIRLTVRPYLGYYVNGSFNTNGFVNGVKVSGGTFSMSELTLKSNPANWKERIYEFVMPDNNIRFEVAYRLTVEGKVKTAYVAEEARRGGGYGSGSDSETATSWGKASGDLQAVINSWTGSNFNEIWIMRGTYTPPDPAVYNSGMISDGDPSNDHFGTGAPPWTAANYRVNTAAYELSGLGTREDISFILRPGLKLCGGFEETDDTKDARSIDAQRKTILSGTFASDGTQVHHVLIAVDADGVLLDTLTVSGAVGPEVSSAISVKRATAPAVPARSVNRQYGGGIYAVNSSMTLENVYIANNTSSRGGGMYVESLGSNTYPSLHKVEFFNNTAKESGGGMFNVATSSICNPSISESVFRENKAVDAGGGLYNAGANCATNVSRTSFTSNSSETGGGIYNAGGNSAYSYITVTGNWTSGNGSGIYNSAEALFYNLDVSGNVSKGGNGIGIYNAGLIRVTNAAISGNSKNASSPYGGGLYNAGTATLANVTVNDNSAGAGGGIANTGTLILANTMVTKNAASSGGGIYNRCLENGVTNVILTNVTIAGNDGGLYGGGIYNEYEGVPEHGQIRNGSLNLVTANVRITGNNGGAIYNRYFRYSGRGIFLTLNNTTIADNNYSGGLGEKGGAGIFSWKDGINQPGSLLTDGFYNGTELTKKYFPVYIRLRNSVIMGNKNSGTSTNHVIDWDGPSVFDPTLPTPVQESYAYSMVEGKALSGSNLNATGKTTTDLFEGPQNPSSPLVTSENFNYRLIPGSVLRNAGNASLYPTAPTLPADNDILDQLFWIIGNDGSLVPRMSQFPIFLGSLPEYRSIEHYLAHDLDFNKGDLRPSYAESPIRKTRPGASLDIGAYEY
ncbi:MAG: hypothetical protein LBJ31_10700 [Treponema sp.]|jgi:hypothetical protein|nr:hypothetical protein [Treponema sp.]